MQNRAPRICICVCVHARSRSEGHQDCHHGVLLGDGQDEVSKQSVSWFGQLSIRIRTERSIACFANQKKNPRDRIFATPGADSRADRRRSRQQIAPYLSGCHQSKSCHRKMDRPMLGGLSRRHGAVRAALHTQNSALLSRGPCGRIVHGERQAATAKSLPRVMMLQSAGSRGRLGLDLPCGRGPARHCFDAGLPSAGRQAVTKARSARQCCGRQFDGGPSALARWDAADITADGRQKRGPRAASPSSTTRCCGGKRLSSIQACGGRREQWSDGVPAAVPAVRGSETSVRAATATGE